MILTSLCSPALLYLIFILIHVMTEMMNEQYKESITKLIIGLLFTLILQAFCMQNMKIISWLLVFVPIILYTYTTLIIFFVFGTNPTDRVKSYVVSS
jgi:hypothetical protein